MSNSLSPKRLPQINQETLERVLEKLRQPSSIAVLASLVAHGVLGAALPSLLASQPEELDTQRRVQVVELSPAEQRQLPSLDAATPLPPSLLPAKPLQPNQPAPKLPDPKVYNDPSLYTLPPYPPPTFSFPVPPSIFDIPAPSARKPPSPPTPKPLAPNPPPDLAPPLASKPSAESKPADADDKDSDQPVPTPGAPTRAEKLSPEQIAALQADAARSRQSDPSYTFNGPETAEQAAGVFNDNAAAFIDVAEKVTGGNADDSRLYKTPEKVTDLFPKDACPFVKELRNASFSAIVKPDGTLAEPPVVLLTSGYKGLDTAAIEDITTTTKNKKFSDGEKFQLIRFDYTFDPKAVCPKSADPA